MVIYLCAKYETYALSMTRETSNFMSITSELLSVSSNILRLAIVCILMEELNIFIQTTTTIQFFHIGS